MIWTWIRRRFTGEPEPFWTDPHRGSASDRLMWMLNDLGDTRWRSRAARRLRAETDRLQPAAWARMDQTLRERMAGYSGLYAPRWVREPDDVRRVALPPGTEAAVLGLLSTHPSGYVREAAVRRLALLDDGAELPPLLLRANDWVPPVRAWAMEALRVRLLPPYAEHWVRALPLVLRLRTTGRADGGPLVDDVLSLLGTTALRDQVWKGMCSPDRAVRRACFRILLNAGRPGLGTLIRDAQFNGDEAVRLEAARAASSLDDGDLHELLPRMAADPFAPVRLVALGLMTERMGRAALPMLRNALLDRSAAIRADARDAVTRLEPMDFAAFYRERVVGDAPRLAEATAGLAETGEADDAERIAPLLGHARSRVRAAALRALARLTGDAAVPALVRAVGDASRGVSRSAADALRPRVGLVDGAALDAWFTGPHAAHVRRNALWLLALRGKWGALPYILAAADDGDPEVRWFGVAHLKRWLHRFNRTFTQPTGAQRERIREALERHASAIDPDAARDIRFSAGLRG